MHNSHNGPTKQGPGFFDEVLKKAKDINRTKTVPIDASTNSSIGTSNPAEELSERSSGNSNPVEEFSAIVPESNTSKIEIFNKELIQNYENKFGTLKLEKLKTFFLDKLSGTNWASVNKKEAAIIKRALEIFSNQNTIVPKADLLILAMDLQKIKEDEARKVEEEKQAPYNNLVKAIQAAIKIRGDLKDEITDEINPQAKAIREAIKKSVTSNGFTTYTLAGLTVTQKDADSTFTEIKDSDSNEVINSDTLAATLQLCHVKTQRVAGTAYENLIKADKSVTRSLPKETSFLKRTKAQIAERLLEHQGKSESEKDNEIIEDIEAIINDVLNAEPNSEDAETALKILENYFSGALTDVPSLDLKKFRPLSGGLNKRIEQSENYGFFDVKISTSLTAKIKSFQKDRQSFFSTTNISPKTLGNLFKDKCPLDKNGRAEFVDSIIKAAQSITETSLRSKLKGEALKTALQKNKEALEKLKKDCGDLDDESVNETNKDITVDNVSRFLLDTFSNGRDLKPCLDVISETELSKILDINKIFVRDISDKIVNLTDKKFQERLDLQAEGIRNDLANLRSGLAETRRLSQVLKPHTAKEINDNLTNTGLSEEAVTIMIDGITTSPSLSSKRADTTNFLSNSPELTISKEAFFKAKSLYTKLSNILSDSKTTTDITSKETGLAEMSELELFSFYKDYFTKVSDHFLNNSNYNYIYKLGNNPMAPPVLLNAKESEQYKKTILYGLAQFIPDLKKAPEQSKEQKDFYEKEQFYHTCRKILGKVEKDFEPFPFRSTEEIARLSPLYDDFFKQAGPKVLAALKTINAAEKEANKQLAGGEKATHKTTLANKEKYLPDALAIETAKTSNTKVRTAFGLKEGDEITKEVLEAKIAEARNADISAGNTAQIDGLKKLLKITDTSKKVTPDATDAAILAGAMKACEVIPEIEEVSEEDITASLNKIGDTHISDKNVTKDLRSALKDNAADITKRIVAADKEVTAIKKGEEKKIKDGKSAEKAYDEATAKDLKLVAISANNQTVIFTEFAKEVREDLALLNTSLQSSTQFTDYKKSEDEAREESKRATKRSNDIALLGKELEAAMIDSMKFEARAGKASSDSERDEFLLKKAECDQIVIKCEAEIKSLKIDPSQITASDAAEAKARVLELEQQLREKTGVQDESTLASEIVALKQELKKAQEELLEKNRLDIEAKRLAAELQKALEAKQAAEAAAAASSTAVDPALAEKVNELTSKLEKATESLREKTEESAALQSAKAVFEEKIETLKNSLEGQNTIQIEIEELKSQLEEANKKKLNTEDQAPEDAFTKLNKTFNDEQNAVVLELLEKNPELKQLLESKEDGLDEAFFNVHALEEKKLALDKKLSEQGTNLTSLNEELEAAKAKEEALKDSENEQEKIELNSIREKRLMLEAKIEEANTEINKITETLQELVNPLGYAKQEHYDKSSEARKFIDQLYEIVREVRGTEIAPKTSTNMPPPVPIKDREHKIIMNVPTDLSAEVIFDKKNNPVSLEIFAQKPGSKAAKEGKSDPTRRKTITHDQLDLQEGQKLHGSNFGKIIFDESAVIKDEAGKNIAITNPKTGAKMRSGIFNGADLKDSSFRGCIFKNVDFSEIKNIETLRFAGCEFEGCTFPKGINFDGKNFNYQKVTISQEAKLAYSAAEKSRAGKITIGGVEMVEGAELRAVMEVMKDNEKGNKSKIGEAIHATTTEQKVKLEFTVTDLKTPPSKSPKPNSKATVRLSGKQNIQNVLAH